MLAALIDYVRVAILVLAGQVGSQPRLIVLV